MPEFDPLGLAVFLGELLPLFTFLRFIALAIAAVCVVLLAIANLCRGQGPEFEPGFQQTDPTLED